MKFKRGEHYRRSVSVQDGLYGPSEISASHWQDADDGELVSIIKISHWGADFRLRLSAQDARNLSDMFLKHAEELDRHKFQIEAH